MNRQVPPSGWHQASACLGLQGRFLFTGDQCVSTRQPGEGHRASLQKISIPARTLCILGAGEVVGRREIPHRASIEGCHPVPGHISGKGNFDLLEAKPEEIGLRFAIKQYQDAESKE